MALSVDLRFAFGCKKCQRLVEKANHIFPRALNDIT